MQVQLKEQSSQSPSSWASSACMFHLLHLLHLRLRIWRRSFFLRKALCSQQQGSSGRAFGLWSTIFPHQSIIYSSDRWARLWFQLAPPTPLCTEVVLLHFQGEERTFLQTVSWRWNDATVGCHAIELNLIIAVKSLILRYFHLNLGHCGKVKDQITTKNSGFLTFS